jgi:Tol biopolymer transport system component
MKKPLKILPLLVIFMFGCSDKNFLNLSPGPAAKTDLKITPEEYGFSAQALSVSYLERKYKAWLGNENGPAMVRELLYTAYKQTPLLRSVLAKNPTMLSSINAMPAVQARRAQDAQFDAFMRSLEQVDPLVTFSFDNSGTNYEVYVMNSDGSGRTNITNRPLSDDYNPDWSPDRRKIAFTSTRDDGNFEIYIMNADGTQQVNISNDPGYDANPAWSPDGSKIAFVSNRNGADTEIYVMDADGGNVTRLTQDPADDMAPVWSPDGSKIAFVSNRDGGNSDIFVMDAGGSDPVNITNSPAEESSLSWSVNDEIAFVSYLNGSSSIYKMNAVGSDPVKVSQTTATEINPAWSKAGDKIFFISYEDSNANGDVYVMDADGANRTNLTRHPGFYNEAK